MTPYHAVCRNCIRRHGSEWIELPNPRWTFSLLQVRATLTEQRNSCTSNAARTQTHTHVILCIFHFHVCLVTHHIIDLLPLNCWICFVSIFVFIFCLCFDASGQTHSPIGSSSFSFVFGFLFSVFSFLFFCSSSTVKLRLKRLDEYHRYVCCGPPTDFELTHRRSTKRNDYVYVYYLRMFGANTFKLHQFNNHQTHTRHSPVPSTRAAPLAFTSPVSAWHRLAAYIQR